MSQQPDQDTENQAGSHQTSKYECHTTKSVLSSFTETSGQGHLPAVIVHSTLKLKLTVVLSSLLSLALMCIAAAESYTQFITLGYVPFAADNSKIARINVAVAGK